MARGTGTRAATRERSRATTTRGRAAQARTAELPFDLGVAARFPYWERVSLGLILVGALILCFFRLGRNGYGNAYYAAGVKSMLQSWHNFFFVSFDAGGYISIDKPPLGLWVQAASAKLFGFGGLSLHVPQAIAGVLSVGLLYLIVRRGYGAAAGVLAALLLAISPVSVAVARNNTMDGLLVLFVLAAAYAAVRAAAGASLRWLLTCALLVGLGFATKSMQAVLALPALFGLYLLAAPAAWARRVAHLALATGVLLAVSLAWPVAVDLTPEDERPYVGSSESNSQLELLFEYNGLERFFGRNQGVAGIGSAPVSREIGGKGPHRLFNERLAGQIGWLLPLALVGGIAAAGRARPWNLSALVREPGAFDERRRQLLLWGGWFGVMYLFFSFAGFFHRYYLVMLAPAVAALAGIGLVTLWAEYRRRDWRGWLLPATLLLTAAVQVFILLDYADWRGRLGPLIGVLALAGAVLLALARLGPRPSRGMASGGLVVGVVALLLAPLVWTWLPVWHSDASLFPIGGPRERNEDSPLTGRGDYYTNAVPFLEAKRDGATFLAATNGALSAARIGLISDQPVLSLGGFTGQDKAINTDQLAALVERGEVRFFHWNVIRLDAVQIAEGLDNPYNHDAWIAANCVEVPEMEWASFNPELAGLTDIDDAPHIFDCRPDAGRTN